MKRQEYVIYRAFNTVTGKSYIGTTASVSVRLKAHLRLLRKNKHHSKKLQNAFNKYGESTFVWEIVETNVRLKNRDAKEIQWIELLDSFNDGYNMTLGGEGMSGYNRKPCVWEGKKYPSFAAAERALGIERRTLAYRVKKGYTCEEDVPHQFSSIPVIWNGINYPSAEEAARQLGIDASSLRMRVSKGYTCDDDLSRERAMVTVEWNGIKYTGFNNCAKSLGISPRALRHRLAKGYTCDDDLKGKRSA